MPKKILLVEDEALIALNEARTIEKHGYEVEIVYNGEEAAERAVSDSSLSLILMDIDLGRGIDGTEAAREILKKREIPIVFLTSHTEKEYVDKVKKITRYGYVLKNSGEFVLIEAINMAFELFHAHNKTKTQERRYRSLIDNSPFGVSVVDGHMRFLTTNPVMADALETDVDSIVGQPLPAFFEGEESEFFLELVKKVLEEGKARSFEVSRGKRNFYVTLVPTPMEDTTTVQIILQDITDFKDTERELREHAEKYRSLFNSIRDAILVADTERTIIDCNSAFSDLFGYQPHDLRGNKTVMVYKSQEEYAQMGEAIKAHRGDLSDFLHTVRYRKKDGTVFPGETNIFYLHDENGEVSGFIGLIRDVSARLETERKLEESEKNLRITLESIGDAVVSTDTQGRVVRMNAVAERLCGWQREEALGTRIDHILNFVNAETEEKVKNPVEKVLTDGEIVSLTNHTKLISKSGIEYQIADSAAPIRDDKGELNGVVMVFRDVSEEYENDRRLRTLMSNLPGMAYRCKNDRKWTMEFVSDGCFDLTGFKKGELEGNQTAAFGDLILPEDNEIVWQDVQEALSRGENFTVRYRMRTKTGRVKWVWEQGVGVYSADRSLLHVEGFITDISSQMQARAELEKALGEKDLLMKELSHRVKNNMAMVSSLIRLKDSEIDDDLSDIIGRIDTVRLVHEKLHRTEVAELIEMKDYLQDVVDAIFSSFSEAQVVVENTVRDVQLEPDVAVPIGLIINELATNALQHGFTTEEEARFYLHMEADEKYFSLVVSNTGNFFPEDVDFDNPHTIGLQLISTLVKQLSGTIKVKRKPMTSFEIQLPRSSP